MEQQTIDSNNGFRLLGRMLAQEILAADVDKEGNQAGTNVWTPGEAGAPGHWDGLEC